MTGNESTDDPPRMREVSEESPEMGTSASAEVDTTLSTPVRWARRGYVFVAGIVVVWVGIQVFIAGMAVFVSPARWGLHAIFGHLLIWPFLLLLVLAFVGRLSRALKLAPVGSLLLLFVQTVTASGFGYGSLVAALHPVTALVIFWLAVVTFRRAWQSLSGDHV